jgi:hypothetical protein
VTDTKIFDHRCIYEKKFFCNPGLPLYAIKAPRNTPAAQAATKREISAKKPRKKRENLRLYS